jgi:DNA-binding NarL/FixJ family response regulator
MEFAAADTAALVRQRLSESHWHMVVLDLSMPGGSGLDMVRMIKEASPGTRILVYTMHAEDQFGVRAVRAGADGFLSKDQPADRLIEAVRKILTGHRFVSDELLDKLAVNLARPERRLPHESLSDREYQVLRSLGGGRSISEIAADLQLSVKTVSTYRTRVLEKLDLRSTADIIRYALEHGLSD